MNNGLKLASLAPCFEEHSAYHTNPFENALVKRLNRTYLKKILNPYMLKTLN